MGYESELYIGERYEFDAPNGCKNIFYENIAKYDLSIMGDENFYNLFKTPIDFPLYDNYEYHKDGEKEYYIWNENKSREDCRGDVCTYASIENVITYLENFMTSKEHYRRILPLLYMLKGFKKEVEENKSWENLIVIHYGY